MAAKRGLRAWAVLALILVSRAGLGFSAGSAKMPGNRETKPSTQPCTWTGCPGTMRLKKNGDYVCHKNSTHKVLAQPAPADQ